MGEWRRRKPNESFETYFWEQVDKSGGDDACWPWLRSLRNGMHGSISRDDKKEWAHRIAYELAHGSRPDGVVRHTCDFGRCCNPKHLVVGTQADNLRDMWTRGRGDMSGLKNSGRPEVSDA